MPPPPVIPNRRRVIIYGKRRFSFANAETFSKSEINNGIMLYADVLTATGMT